MVSTSEATTGFTNEAFEEFLATRQEPAWVIEGRRAAWKTFSELELPSRSHEEWRRTDVRLLKLNQYGFPRQDPGLDQLPAALLAHNVELGGHMVAVNSVPTSSSLDEAAASQGVLFGSLDELIAEHGDLLEPLLMRRAFEPTADKFAALHAAAWSGGTLLYVPKGVKLSLPLHALSVLSDGGVDLSHTLVILEEGAEATLMAETASAGGGPGLHCGGIELLLHPQAKLRYVTLQNWNQKVWHFAHQKALVDRDADLQWTIGALGSRLAKVNQHVALIGQKANVQVNGVMFTENRQHLAYHTLQHHKQPDGTSDLLYKGALQDNAHLVWRGMIKVDPQAQKTNGYQRNDNLMLSSNARTDSIPGLEIEADDVLCTHGATTGRVEEETIFYAQTRGLTRQEATRMIVAGFFQQIFDRITIQSVREALAEAISHKVQALTEAQETF